MKTPSQDQQQNVEQAPTDTNIPNEGELPVVASTTEGGEPPITNTADISNGDIAQPATIAIANGESDAAKTVLTTADDGKMKV